MRGLWLQAGHAVDGANAILARMEEARLTNLLCDVMAGNFAEIVETAQAAGIRTHAWTYQHMIYWHNSAWSIRNSRGESMDWADFTIPEARQWWADYCASIEAQRGCYVCLDYIRWPTQLWGTRAYMTADAVRDTVVAVKARVNRPLSAAVFVSLDEYLPGQRWREWLADGIIDYTMPMCYGDVARVQKYAPTWPADGVVPGLSLRYLDFPTGQWERWFDASEIVAIIEECRQFGFWDFALFDYSALRDVEADIRAAIGGTMAQLSAEDRARIWRGLARYWSNLREVCTISKAERLAAVEATDIWIDNNTASYNSALPEAARTELTASQKTLLFCAVALMRVTPGLATLLQRALGTEVD